MALISIIICGRNKYLLEDLSFNIKETIGCEYELIIIDNSKNQYSIFEAYNEGLRKSRYSIVCFIHEDIIFHTQGWGVILSQTFSENEVKLLGVAGSRVKSDVPSGWWEQPNDSLVINIIQHRPNGSKEHITKGFAEKEHLERVSVLDGVFLAISKDSKIKFNEELSGFHNYDLSFCIDALNFDYKIGVTRKILIEHFSNGRIDNSWVNSSHQFHEKYKERLPINLENYKLTRDHKIIQLQQFIIHCKNAGNVELFLNYWLRLFKERPFSIENLKYLIYFMRFTIQKISNKWN